MSSIILDTHAIIWYFLDSKKLSEVARDTIDAADRIYISSISVVEMIYLNEKSKISNVAIERLNQALTELDAQWFVASLDLPTAQSIADIKREVVPEMPDRIVAATAAYLGLPLVTRDSKIQNSTIQTIW
jgi:PIN domain nuclease of toxin-antitoxin system